MVRHGVAPDFVEKAINTPHSSMWQPDLATLRKAGVVTGVAAPGQFAAPSFGTDHAAAMDRTVLNSPLFAALRRADPKAYEATRGELLRELQQSQGGSDDLAFGSTQFSHAFDHAAAIASDQSLVDFVSATTELLELVNLKSGPLCMLIATGRPYPVLEVRQILPDYLVQKKIMATAAVLESSVTSPQPAPSREQVKDAVHRLLVKLANALPEEFQYLRTPGLDPGRGCFMWNEVYKKALQADPAERSVLLRGLLGNLL
jgi:hypothetical protein